MLKNITTGFELTIRFFTEELQNILRDRGALLILIFALIIYPVIYGIAYKNEVVRNIPVAVVDLDQTASSRQLVRMIGGTEQLNIATTAGSLAEAQTLFYSGQVYGVILIPELFEKDLMTSQQTSVTVYSDAGYFLIYKQTLSGALRASATFSAGVEIKRLLAKGASLNQAMERRDPVSLNTVMLFNPSGGYNSFVIPGLMIIILQQTLLIGIGLLGGTQREIGRSRFSIPQALNRGGVIPVVMGKAGAYFMIYLFNVIITQIWVYKWFNLPSKGSFFAVMALIIPFLLAVTFLGMALSTFFNKRENSIIFMVFLSPLALFLSGLSWPVEAIPNWLNKLALVFPSTIMVPNFLRVRTMGADITQVSNGIFSLWTQTIIYALLSLVLFYFAARRKH